MRVEPGEVVRFHHRASVRVTSGELVAVQHDGSDFTIYPGGVSLAVRVENHDRRPAEFTLLSGALVRQGGEL